MTDQILTPELIEQLGLKKVCRVCRPKELKLGKMGMVGQMCPLCGNHFDEFGNHNKMKAHKWIYATFQQAGFDLSEKHIESLYMLARIKVSNNEAPYLQTIEAALNTLRDGGRLP